MANFNFAYKEDAQNFADNYGGSLHDNTHSRGSNWGQSANSNAYVVHQDDNNDDSPEYRSEEWFKNCGIEFIHTCGSIVFHEKFGRGVIKYTSGWAMSNRYVEVNFDIYPGAIYFHEYALDNERKTISLLPIGNSQASVTAHHLRCSDAYPKLKEY